MDAEDEAEEAVAPVALEPTPVAMGAAVVEETSPAAIQEDEAVAAAAAAAAMGAEAVAEERAGVMPAPLPQSLSSPPSR